MPFDGTGYPRRTEILDKMDQVIHLLSDEQRWCKRELEDEGRRCIVGALIAVDALILKKPIRKAIEQVTGEYYLKVEAFNDHPQTTHALVITVLQRARENIANSGETASHLEHALRSRFWDVFR